MAFKQAHELSPANPMDPVVREDSASRAAGHVPSAELVDDKIGKIHPLACIVSLSCCKFALKLLLDNQLTLRVLTIIVSVQEKNRRV